MTTKYTAKFKTYTVFLKEPDTLTVKERAQDPEKLVPILKAFYQSLDADREHFSAVFLNKKLDVLAIKNLFSGAIDETPVYPAVIMRDALLIGATAVILCHNHPSGRLQPSPEDLQITSKIKEAGNLLGIRIMDHIILTASGYFSFTTEGIL